jgi:DNA-binding response OmpR family regulator
MKTILIVDDQEDLRLLVTSILKPKYQTICASSGESALAMAIEHQPDLVLLDIGLPDISGFEVCSEMRSIKNMEHIPIIFLTAKRGVNAHVMGYRLGGDHYIEKPFDEAELLAIIESKFKTKNLVELISFGDLVWNPGGHRISCQGENLKLSPLELKILKLFISNPGKIMSREFILNKFWNITKEVSDRAVDNHLSTLRKKIKFSKCEIETVYSEGYRMVLSD